MLMLTNCWLHIRKISYSRKIDEGGELPESSHLIPVMFVSFHLLVNSLYLRLKEVMNVE